MNILKHATATLAGALLLIGCSGGGAVSLDEASYNDGLHVIPQPVEMTLSQEVGRWTLTSSTKIIGDESLAPVTDFLRDKIEASTGYTLPVESASSKPASEIRFTSVKRLSTRA